MNKNRHAALAAVLSFVYPGLGHAYLGLRRQALVFAIPAAIVTVALVLVALTQDLDSTLGYLIAPSGAMTALVLVVLTGGWRVVAMVDAVLAARRRSGLGAAGVFVAALMLVAVVAPHAAGAVFTYSLYDASSRIFVAAGPDDTAHALPTGNGPSVAGVASEQPTDDYQATPLVTPKTDKDRINILLTGVDSAETRSHSLTDTLLVVSLDPNDGSVVMVSLPRDISNFELYDGRTYKGKINSLMTWARNHPKEFPDGPFPTLMKEVGYLIGVPIHYYAAVDLQGFRKLINAVGGVTVDNPKAINDPRYDWLDGTWGFSLPAGNVKLDGRTALAYVRSRQGVGDTDYTRAARQQQLLVAVRNKLASPGMVTKLPDILQVAGDTVRTNLPTRRLDEFIHLGRSVDPDHIKKYVLGPPYAYHPDSSTTDGVWTLRLRMAKVAALSRKLFGEDSRYASTSN